MHTEEETIGGNYLCLLLFYEHFAETLATHFRLDSEKFPGRSEKYEWITQTTGECVNRSWLRKLTGGGLSSHR